LTEEKKEITSQETTATETAPEVEEAVTEETTEKDAPAQPEVKDSAPEAAGDTAKSETSGTDTPEQKAESSKNGENQHHGYEGDDRRRDQRHRGGYGRRGDRPLSNEDKVKMYKKQSEERLLDIKRSREDKIGKKRKR
jgi:hypothetical protein